jgi:uncharacterized membrane protein
MPFTFSINMKYINTLILVLIFAVIPSGVRAQTTEPPVVHAFMFWQAGCSLCEETIKVILPPIREKYGAQFELLMIEVTDMKDVEFLYRVAASYGISKAKTQVPFLIIGDQVLVGSADIEKKLSKLIDRYLAQGGMALPENPTLSEILSRVTPESPSTSEPAEETPLPVDLAPETPTEMKSNGFTLAIVIMIAMGIALLYSLIAFTLGRTFSLPAWGDWLIPVLTVFGIGVAGYLSYIETQSTYAACGPIGDCNTVQQSRYARLFDILPVGVLGLLGYLSLLATWMTRKFIRRFEKPAAIGFWAMAFFAVIFSLYLTYLEPFVIKAVCIWCLSSAVIVTLLLLLGTPTAVRQFAISDEEE